MYELEKKKEEAKKLKIEEKQGKKQQFGKPPMVPRSMSDQLINKMPTEN